MLETIPEAAAKVLAFACAMLPADGIDVTVWMLLVNGALALFTAIYVGITYCMARQVARQSRIMARQSIEMRRQSGILADQAAEMDRQSKAMLDQLKKMDTQSDAMLVQASATTELARIAQYQIREQEGAKAPQIRLTTGRAGTDAVSMDVRNESEFLASDVDGWIERDDDHRREKLCCFRKAHIGPNKPHRDIDSWHLISRDTNQSLHLPFHGRAIVEATGVLGVRGRTEWLIEVVEETVRHPKITKLEQVAFDVISGAREIPSFDGCALASSDPE